MTTHRTVLLTLVASIAALAAPAGAAAKTIDCKSGRGEVIAGVQAKGSASCAAALQVADVFWQMAAMVDADKRGDYVEVTDPKTGIKAESFTSKGWRCVRSTKRTVRPEDPSSSVIAGAAKCVKGKRIVTWQLVDGASTLGEGGE